jgi:hypothetical protein
MRKYKFRTVPAAQKASVYAEGKQAFDERKHRSYNPYVRSDLALATIWWNGWDTSEEEAGQPGRRKPARPVLLSDRR